MVTMSSFYVRGSCCFKMAPNPPKLGSLRPQFHVLPCNLRFLLRGSHFEKERKPCCFEEFDRVLTKKGGIHLLKWQVPSTSSICKNFQCNLPYWAWVPFSSHTGLGQSAQCQDLGTATKKREDIVMSQSLEKVMMIRGKRGLKFWLLFLLSTGP